MLKRNIVTYFLALGIMSVSTHVIACADHLYYDTQNMGFLGKAAARMVGLAPPERVFKLKHTATAWAVVGEQEEIEVEYRRPFFAKAVRIELSGSDKVELSEDSFQLDDRTGVVNIRFQVKALGYNTINLTVLGEHKGELVREYSRIYVRSKAKPAVEDIQVSAR